MASVGVWNRSVYGQGDRKDLESVLNVRTQNLRLDVPSTPLSPYTSSTPSYTMTRSRCRPEQTNLSEQALNTDLKKKFHELHIDGSLSFSPGSVLNSMNFVFMDSRQAEHFCWWFCLQKKATR